MSWGKIYNSTWWGNPIKDGWGGIYYDIANPIVGVYADRVEADGGVVEAEQCVSTFIEFLQDN